MPESFSFIDLFAGIGGTRLAFQEAGGRCVFSSEWDSFACDTYQANFGERPAGDITRIPSFDIPQHDILVGGFPCQPFSIAGVTKHKALGNGHGFDHPTQGTLFFHIRRIIDECRPRAFLLENVKNLLSHDGGRTFEVIQWTLKEELKYDLHWRVIDARGVVPQHRERLYMVGFREKTAFKFPEFESAPSTIRSILEPNVPERYMLSDHLWNYLQDYFSKHKAKGNGFGYGLIADLDNDVTRTLSARYYKDGSEILIPSESGPPRRLTPRECARLMGFPESFKIVVSDTQAYKQFGNSVAVPVVKAVASQIAGRVATRRSPDVYVKGRSRITLIDSPVNGTGNGFEAEDVQKALAGVVPHAQTKLPMAGERRRVYRPGSRGDASSDKSHSSRPRIPGVRT